jgi:hypothetical protein
VHRSRGVCASVTGFVCIGISNEALYRKGSWFLSSLKIIRVSTDIEALGMQKIGKGAVCGF